VSAFTVAEARGLTHHVMHCLRGHRFLLSAAYRDPWGTWCPECGNPAESQPVKRADKT